MKTDSQRPFVSCALAAASFIALAGCAALSGSAGSPSGTGGATAPVAAMHTEWPSALQRAHPTIPSTTGPTIFVYEMPVDGFTDPNHGGVSPDAASFNQIVYGVATPPVGSLTGAITTLGGNAGAYVELTVIPKHDQIYGTALLACNGQFTNNGPNRCLAAKGSKTKKHIKVNEFLAVQSWPFYVGTSTSSNLSSGTYAFETSTDDGSYIVIGPAAFTYAQSGNFQGTSGLVSGTALVQNGGAHAPTSRTGQLGISAQTCASDLYWLTFEWYEILGGLSGLEYSWQPPGTSQLVQPTQDVLWGQVTSKGTPIAGAPVTVGTLGSGSANLLTDSDGCYGYNYPPVSSVVTITVTVTANGKQQTKTAPISSGTASKLNFTF